MSTIKGAQLHANGDLNEMLTYNATQMFIEAFDSVAEDYPQNENLWSNTITFNNITLFRHLRKHPRMTMVMDITALTSYLKWNCHIEMLQHFFDNTFDRMLPSTAVSCLPLAVDTGNEHIMRLFLQHFKLDDKAINCSPVVKFKRRGVGVVVLKVLHEEFNSLFGLTELWHRALMHSIKCNMMDSVQYILDNMPWPEPSQPDVALNILIGKCLGRCAKAGNMLMFQLLNKWPFVANFIEKNSITDIITIANDHGHQSIVEYLRQQQQHQHLDLAGPFCITPLSVIRNNDLELVQSHPIDLPPIKLSIKMFQRMSKPMAEYVLSPHSKIRLPHGIAVLNMSMAAGELGSNITANMVAQYIATHPTKDHNYEVEETLMKYAAGFSAEIMKQVHTHYGTSYKLLHLVKALKKKCRETLALLFIELRQQIQDIDKLDEEDEEDEEQSELKYDIKQYAQVYISSESLDDVTSLLDHIESVRRIPNIYRIMPMACPSMNTLIKMAETNSIHSLEFYFNSSTFANMPITHRLRTIYAVKNIGYEHGMTRVINLCSDHIKSITDNDVYQQQQQQVVDSKMQIEPSYSRQLETAVHFVFGNRKLGMIIMEQVGVVHKSLGVEARHVIKGAQLIDRHCLNDYIRFNLRLLGSAMTRCDSRVVDVLLANPIMSLPTIDNKQFYQSFISNVSTCSHPDWERMFDQVMMFLFQSNALDLDINKLGSLSSIQHPSFFRKLIRCGVKLQAMHTTEDINKICGGGGWLDKPWAQEMLQLLLQHNLLNATIHPTLFIKAIQLNVAPVINHFVRTSLAGWLSQYTVWIANDIVQAFGKHGSLELLEKTILPIVCTSLNERTLLATILKESLIVGHMDVANLCLTALAAATTSAEATKKKERVTPSIVNSIHHSIMSVELIERLIAKPVYIKYKLSFVMGDAIKHRIKPVINMMKDAHIKSYNNRLKNDSPITIDYRYALVKALEVGDMDTIKWLLGNVKSNVGFNGEDLCILLDGYNTDSHERDFEEVESAFVEVSGYLKRGPKSISRYVLNRLLIIASNKSLAAIKMVVHHCSDLDKNNNKNNEFIMEKLDNSLFKQLVDASIKRDDIQSLEYVIGLAPKEEHPSEFINLEHCSKSVLNHCLDKGYFSVDQHYQSSKSSDVLVNKQMVDEDHHLTNELESRWT
ncbi:hypothetical protein SAMD00019534_101030 [Acytostelium subglobosum LB1]|uniref:hypothetical protein n=1 Tax=Acytostelium subglobosum LB1 TaxID=1410327 RepID=UPI00064483BC|nr:hypothetical protein SAMD00019534_101030 [Acytostelium subglobosum LB1]GAM26928.1 hypothetical protein SAMD00019534_101030 [Acytostelium subglobosum LB1]|eukprot:XP_012750196.1 hypothetical protein SAMD00019534_101030 [Acytostelium subglobosum LB1]